MHDIGTGYMAWLKSTTIAAYETTLATLPDPPLEDVDEALRLGELLIDALEGFAYGSVMGHIAVTVARLFGETKGRQVHHRLRRFLHLRRFVYFADDAPTLREHVRRHLCGRLAYLPTRTMIEDTLQYITQSHVLAIVFVEAQQDTLHADRLRHELATGWQHLVATLRGVALPTVSPLWSEWQRRALRMSSRHAASSGAAMST
ncbi:MAG: hypothetical protein JO257_23870 [Deltaproteobacteria bacterium]|nr:hypothetical protein [Deltaproteobacteria bacterium]